MMILDKYLLAMEGQDGVVLRLIVGFVLSLILALVFQHKKSLTKSGAIAMVVSGTIIYGSGGLSFAVPIIWFFLSSSSLSDIMNSVKSEAMSHFDKSGARDYRQVLANSIVASLCVIFFITSNWSGWYLIYIAAVCEAAADTWATEIGTLSSKPPISILTFKPVNRGQSGGISLLGTLAAFAGAISTSVIAAVILRLIDKDTINLDMLIMIGVIAGFMGFVADSILGATLQGMYRHPQQNRLTEKACTNEIKNELVAGIRFIDNDAVNILGTLTAAVIAYILVWVFFG